MNNQERPSRKRSSSSYPNFKAVLILSTCFFTLFLAFNAAADSAAKALGDSGFDNLGYYSLSTVYFSFAIGSIFAPWMIKKLNPKSAIVLASTVYALWIVSLTVTTLIPKNEFLSQFLGYYGISAIVLGVAVLCGPGCALLWVA